jgi:hypothetical protein
MGEAKILTQRCIPSCITVTATGETEAEETLHTAGIELLFR